MLRTVVAFLHVISTDYASSEPDDHVLESRESIQLVTRSYTPPSTIQCFLFSTGMYLGGTSESSLQTLLLVALLIKISFILSFFRAKSLHYRTRPRKQRCTRRRARRCSPTPVRRRYPGTRTRTSFLYTWDSGRPQLRYF